MSVGTVRRLTGHKPMIDVDLLDEPGERYQMEALLGEGTFGEVHKALDSQTNKKVAIKIFDNLGRVHISSPYIPPWLFSKDVSRSHFEV